LVKIRNFDFNQIQQKEIPNKRDYLELRDYERMMKLLKVQSFVQKGNKFKSKAEQTNKISKSGSSGNNPSVETRETQFWFSQNHWRSDFSCFV